MKGNDLPLVVTFNPNFKNVSFPISEKLQFCYADSETRPVFTPAPFISFRSARNFKSFLVTSVIYPLERKVDFGKCNSKRYQVYLNINKTDTFESI